MSIYAIVGHELNDQTVLTSSIKRVTVNRSKLWEATFNVKWPEVMSFKEINKSKALTSKNAALKCLRWLETNGKLRNGKPLVYSKEDLKNMQFKSVELNVAPEILNNMSDLINTYKMVKCCITIFNVIVFH